MVSCGVGGIVKEREQSKLLCVPTSTGVPRAFAVYSSSQMKRADDGSAFDVDWKPMQSVI